MLGKKKGTPPPVRQKPTVCGKCGVNKISKFCFTCGLTVCTNCCNGHYEVVNWSTDNHRHQTCPEMSMTPDIVAQAQSVDPRTEESIYVNVRELAGQDKVIQEQIEALIKQMNVRIEGCVAKEKEMLIALEKGRNQVVQKVNKHFDQEKHSLTTAMRKCKDNIKTEFEKQIGELRDPYEKIGPTPRCGEAGGRSATTMAIFYDTTFELVNKDSNLSSFDDNKALQICRKEQPTTLHPQDRLCDTANIRKEYIVSTTLPVSEQVQHLLPISGQLWCMQRSKVTICDLAGNSVNVIASDNMKTVQGIADYGAENYIIVATEKDGLFIVDKTGQYIGLLDDGPYLNVTCSQLNIYGLKKGEQIEVIVFTYDANGKPGLPYTLATGIPTDSYRFTCTVLEEKLYICSQGNHCIYQINLQNGKTIQTIGIFGAKQGSGYLYNPLVAGSAGKDILVCDMNNHQIQALDVRTLQWRLVKLHIANPTSAVLTEDGWLFIAGGRFPNFSITIHKPVP